jgi:hypothetical protein
MPPLVTIPGVDLLATGSWNLSTGEATFTAEDLASAVAAAQCPAIGNPVIKLGHVDPRFDGEPAVGHVSGMALANSGNKIKGDLAGIPGWLGASMNSSYPSRSIEGVWDFQCQIGHVHPFVITALALLGVSMPGVGVLSGLQDVAALYGVAAARGEPDKRWRLDLKAGGTMPDTVMAAGVTTEDVRRAYYDAPETPFSYWITAMYLDPPQLIVSDETSTDMYRVPVTIKGGAVTFGEPVKVEIEYQDVAAGRQVAVWASAAKSRSGTVRAAPAADADPDDDPMALCAALDATLDQASGLLSGVDLTTLPAEVQQALALMTAAEATCDSMMEAMGIPDPDDPEESQAGGPHGSYTGTHSHAHSPMGSQGSDATHDHSHTHSGDAVHNHAHAGAGNRRGGSEVDFTDEQMAALRASLGLAEEAELTPEVLVTSVASLGTQATAAAGATRRLPQGVIAVEQEAWDALNHRVQAGEQDRQARLRGERDQVIMAAIRDGKLSVARRGHWERLWNADPEGTREVLAGLQKNVIPVDDLGSAGGGLGDELLDEEYRSLFPPGATTGQQG